MRAVRYNYNPKRVRLPVAPNPRSADPHPDPPDRHTHRQHGVWLLHGPGENGRVHLHMSGAGFVRYMHMNMHMHPI